MRRAVSTRGYRPPQPLPNMFNVVEARRERREIMVILPLSADSRTGTGIDVTGLSRRRRSRALCQMTGTTPRPERLPLAHVDLLPGIAQPHLPDACEVQLAIIICWAA